MKRDRAYLEDILDSASAAIGYIAGTSRDKFLTDRLLQDALIRRIAVIGEASRRLSEPTRLLFPAVPWKAVIGMRNILIHNYDGVDFETVWDTVHNSLPPLIAAVEAFLREHPQD